jgi:phage protein U
MIIGSLGGIPFYTSMDKSVLLSGLEWSSGARYAEHTRHNQTDMLEYVGLNPDKMTFDVQLSAFLGVNPTLLLDRFRTVHKERQAVKFVLGTMPLPGFWVLTDIKSSLEQFYKDGTLLSVNLQITLSEYVDQVDLPIITTRMTFADRLISGNTVKASEGSDRSPVVDYTSGSVRMNKKPVTKPAEPSKSLLDILGNIVKPVVAVASAVSPEVRLGVTVVKKATELAEKYNVVEVLKNAAENIRDYNATKTQPVSPVVVREDSGVHPSSTKHTDWLNTAK